MLDLRELVRYVALRLFLEHRPHVSSDATIDALHLRDEALIHTEDVVGVVAAQPHQLKDVGDGHWCDGRVEAEHNFAVLGLQQDSLLA